MYTVKRPTNPGVQRAQLACLPGKNKNRDWASQRAVLYFTS